MHKTFVVALFVALAAVTGKQLCDECYTTDSWQATFDTYYEPYLRFENYWKPWYYRSDSCSDAPIRCPDGEACLHKEFTDQVGSGLTSFGVKTAYGFSTACHDVSKKTCPLIYKRTSCEAHYKFDPDVCYQTCYMTQLNVSGTVYDVEDTCQQDNPQLEECPRGFACNILTLTAQTQYLQAGRNDTMTMRLVGCGISEAYCSIMTNMLRETIPDLVATGCSGSDISELSE